MTPQVKLVVTSNTSKDITYSYNEPSECIVGCAFDCDIQLPVSEEKDVSLHHCLFEIEPPHLWVQDLDSKNGTFVNDLKIAHLPDDGMYELRNGDEVRLGNYVLQIRIDGIDVLHELMDSAFINANSVP